MFKTIEDFVKYVSNNFGKDDSIVGLTGLKRKTEYVYVTVPKEFKKTYIQNTERNYLLL